MTASSQSRPQASFSMPILKMFLLVIILLGFEASIRGNRK
jgi:hypothetical protein